jgi:hypothetical protein
MPRKIKECLMLETSDKKKFFTPKRNYNKILEFANSFNCEISTVQLEEGEVLDLIPLAAAISTEQCCKRAKFEVVELKKPRKYKKRNG